MSAEPTTFPEIATSSVYSEGEASPGGSAGRGGRHAGASGGSGGGSGGFGSAHGTSGVGSGHHRGREGHSERESRARYAGRAGGASATAAGSGVSAVTARTYASSGRGYEGDDTRRGDYGTDDDGGEFYDDRGDDGDDADYDSRDDGDDGDGGSYGSDDGDDRGSDPEPDAYDDDAEGHDYDAHGGAGGAGAGPSGGAGGADLGGYADMPAVPMGTAEDFNADGSPRRGGEAKLVRLIPSLFAHRKATVVVDYPAYLGISRDLPDTCRTLAPGSRKIPAFKISEAVHEYNCVRNAFLRAGFRRTTTSNWTALWGRHLTESEYTKLSPYQKVNHFPGTWAIGRKDRLARNLARMKRDFGDHFDFHSKTYQLPTDRRKLREEMEAEPKTLWILKPCASSCGRGIKLASHAAGTSIPKGKAYLAQKYVKSPYLINGYKFDLRIYVLVTCFDPLRVYLFHDGLVRFCTVKYSTSTKSIKNRFQHLTNYSVNKKSEKFDKNTDASKDGEGTKWSLQALRKYFRNIGIDDEKVMANIKDVIIKTLISSESHVGSLVQRYFRNRGPHHPGSNCFEVFGFDVLLDKHLKAWILEVNVSPSLSSSSPLDKKIKNTLMTDVFHLVGFHAHDVRQDEKDAERQKMDRLLGLGKGGMAPSRTGVSRHRNVRELSGMGPGDLLPDELAVICETEEELSRRGHFQRIFPADNAAYYLQFFEAPRFNNVLLLMWNNKWKAMVDTGSVPRGPGTVGTYGTHGGADRSGSASPAAAMLLKKGSGASMDGGAGGSRGSSSARRGTAASAGSAGTGSDDGGADADRDSSGSRRRGRGGAGAGAAPRRGVSGSQRALKRPGSARSGRSGGSAAAAGSTSSRGGAPRPPATSLMRGGSVRERGGVAGTMGAPSGSGGRDAGFGLAEQKESYTGRDGMLTLLSEARGTAAGSPRGAAAGTFGTAGAAPASAVPASPARSASGRAKKAAGGFEHDGDSPFGNVAVLGATAGAPAAGAAPAGPGSAKRPAARDSVTDRARAAATPPVPAPASTGTSSLSPSSDSKAAPAPLPPAPAGAAKAELPRGDSGRALVPGSAGAYSDRSSVSTGSGGSKDAAGHTAIVGHGGSGHTRGDTIAEEPAGKGSSRRSGSADSAGAEPAPPSEPRATGAPPSPARSRHVIAGNASAGSGTTTGARSASGRAGAGHTVLQRPTPALQLDRAHQARQAQARARALGGGDVSGLHVDGTSTARSSGGASGGRPASGRRRPTSARRAVGGRDSVASQRSARGSINSARGTPADAPGTLQGRGDILVGR